MAARKVLLIGANGQLGSDIAAVFSADPRFDLLGVTHDRLDVCRKEQVAEAVRLHGAEVVINTAAFHQLDRCEEDPGTAFSVNAAAVKGLCDACADAGATLVHFSTDYVFDGGKTSPYAEEDPAWPVNVYGASKLAGECIALSSLEKRYVLRVSGLYGRTGPRGKGLNFPDLMVKLAKDRGELKVVDDQVLTPTATVSVARRLAAILGRAPYGLYHFTDDGECSWFEFASAILEITGIPARIEPVKSGFFGDRVRRPAYSVLSKGKVREHAGEIPHWRVALAEYLRARGAAR